MWRWPACGDQRSCSSAGGASAAGPALRSGNQRVSIHRREPSCGTLDQSSPHFGHLNKEESLMRSAAALLLTTACILGLTTPPAAAAPPGPAPASSGEVVDLPVVAGYVIQTVTALGGLR